MASAAKRLPGNVPGPFYVDATCIDCDTCNWLAPAVFGDGGDGQSRVHHQPRDAAERRQAAMAVIACPVGAIGAGKAAGVAALRDAFPDPIEDNVYHCGYHAAASFGAASYLIVRPEGNVLVDSPRFARPLVAAIERLGGVRSMFLTHLDDVADHAQFHAHFGCERILHRRDVRPETAAVEIILDGDDAVALAPDLLAIPVPGHTAGSMCLLAERRFLFAGDHAAWDPERQRIAAFREVCWFDWAAQRRSMARLADFRCEWLLPGHGWRCHLPADRMQTELRACAASMAEA